MFPVWRPSSLGFCSSSNIRIIFLIPNTNSCNRLTSRGNLHSAMAAPSHDLHSRRGTKLSVTKTSCGCYSSRYIIVGTAGNSSEDDVTKRLKC